MSDIETTEKNKNNFLPGQGSNPQEAAQRLQDIGSSILGRQETSCILACVFWMWR